MLIKHGDCHFIAENLRSLNTSPTSGELFKYWQSPSHGLGEELISDSNQ